MINPVSSTSIAAAVVAKTQSANTQPAASTDPQDSVQLSPQAKAALQGADADHDGDSK